VTLLTVGARKGAPGAKESTGKGTTSDDLDRRERGRRAREISERGDCSRVEDLKGGEIPSKQKRGRIAVESDETRVRSGGKHGKMKS